MQLQEKTATSQDIPDEQAFPSKAANHPSCKWIEIPNRVPSVCNLSAHWMGAGLTNRKIIACEYPRPKNYTEQWRMINQYASYLIIDLRNEIDQKGINQMDFKGKNRYPETFYPSSEFELQLKDKTTVKYTGINGARDCYNIKDVNGVEKHVERLHYQHWPDGGIIPVYKLDYLVEQCLSPKWQGVIIHCLAGVGRTGTLIAASILNERIKAGQLTEKDLNFEYVANLVYDLRRQRSKAFVSQPEQFELLFLYATWLLWLKKPFYAQIT